jgi:hypothetical protein
MNDDAQSGEWIRERLSPPRDLIVTSIVPSGFEAYARILHPVLDPLGGVQVVRWADDSAWSGIVLHPLVQWYEIALPEVAPMTDSPSLDRGPREGSLALADAEVLVEDLSAFTPRSSGCVFGVWRGYGDGIVHAPADTSVEDTPVGRRPSAPNLVLPYREYELSEGPLAMATSFFSHDGHRYQSPNLWWPSDCSWCVASEIDLPWTYVGGPRPLVESLLADTRLEALHAAPDDPFWMPLVGWIVELVAESVDEVLSKGSASLAFAAGTVDVRLETSGRRQKGVIITRSERANGRSGSSTPVDIRRPDELRAEVESRVQAAILALVGS